MGRSFYSLMFRPPPFLPSFLPALLSPSPTYRRYAHSSDPACESCVGRPRPDSGRSVTAHGSQDGRESLAKWPATRSHSSCPLSKLRHRPSILSSSSLPSSLSDSTPVLSPRDSGYRLKRDKRGQAALATNNDQTHPPYHHASGGPVALLGVFKVSQDAFKRDRCRRRELRLK